MRRIGGVYGTTQTSGDMDGRLLASASRYKRVARAVAGMEPAHVKTLEAFAHHEMTGVMLASQKAIAMHRAARSRRSLPDWLARIAPRKDKAQKPEHQRLWLELRSAATRELDNAMNQFSMRWRKR